MTSGVALPLADVRRMLESTPAVFTSLLSPLPPALLHVNEGENTWSPFQVLCHVTWGEIDDWMPRVRLVLERGSHQTFTPFDREAGFQRYEGWPVDRLLAEFARLRAESLAAFDACALSAADLAREGRHPEFGRVTLEELLATWVTHDFAHRSQITRVLTRYYGASAGPWRKYFRLLN